MISLHAHIEKFTLLTTRFLFSNVILNKAAQEDIP
ncbi:hypothetical protein SAMN05421740_11114 [Parapedobacter koreensis]|uniref:Uncharacterized protein n=1 Tax=Parapedobacter koreensis TaxID=332977 RepID=A0A1H7TFH5_9SPHI|nr:hypothetical protein SAMN05421740_11114 [Parapedobacter koreensis]